jgi:NADPH:quinone reductase-like Zn-dependent oxidoreductase
MIKGQYNPRLKLPIIPLSDGAGEIVETGRTITGFNIGDHVCTTMIPAWEDGAPSPGVYASTLGGPADGCLSEYRDFTPDELMLLPGHLSFEQAATLPVAGLTAWNALQTLSPATNATVLLLGTGGVSLAALGIAKALGFTTIITSSSHQKLDLARKLGADHTINYVEEPRWEKAVKSLVPGGCDLVVEVGGQGTFNRSLRSLAPGGKIALIGVLSKLDSTIDLTRILMFKIDVHGILVGSRKQFRKYLTFVKQTGITPHIGQSYQGMAHIHQALELMDSGKHFGKITLNF